ncbi:MAG: hypothetical protein Q7R72_02210 [bacterium]|nr:hypothetical protein [bacterium]
MTPWKKYSESEVSAVVNALVATARARKSEYDVPHEFIKEHPWTLKYLSHFAEANDFMQIAKTEGVQIVLDEVRMKERIRRGLIRQICFRIFVPEGTQIRTKEETFRFERQSDGTFIALNC